MTTTITTTTVSEEMAVATIHQTRKIKWKKIRQEIRTNFLGYHYVDVPVIAFMIWVVGAIIIVAVTDAAAV